MNHGKVDCDTFRSHLTILSYFICISRLLITLCLNLISNICIRVFPAPEILQGKNGHSFEVDVWSTGVIIYTLLVGRPPYESKDVESTYKRILSNSFAFPDQAHPVCEHAKNLIRNILQVSEERYLKSYLYIAFFYFFIT